MPLKTRVMCGIERACSKCKGAIPVGTWAVKDRTLKKEKGIVLYYHEECPKGKKK